MKPLDGSCATTPVIQLDADSIDGPAVLKELRQPAGAVALGAAGGNLAFCIPVAEGLLEPAK